MGQAKQRQEQLGDHEIETRFREQMNDIAAALDRSFNGLKTGPDRQVGFTLLIYNLGEAEDRRANYISNSNRADMVVMLKELIQRFEGQPKVQGSAC